MWTPKSGPYNALITEFHQAPKNNLAGYVEKASVSEFNFDMQRKTFQSYGYAIDPSTNQVGDGIVGDTAEASNKNSMSVFLSSNINV